MASDEVTVTLLPAPLVGGTPANTTRSGTSSTTAAPAPIVVQSPTRRTGMIDAPAADGHARADAGFPHRLAVGPTRAWSPTTAVVIHGAPRVEDGVLADPCIDVHTTPAATNVPAPITRSVR